MYNCLIFLSSFHCSVSVSGNLFRYKPVSHRLGMMETSRSHLTRYYGIACKDVIQGRSTEKRF